MSRIPNLGYHLARAEGKIVRGIYTANLPKIARPPSRVREVDLPFEVCSYSGENMLPEQVASIRSFFRHAGRPKKFTVVSDGTHSSRSLSLLRALSVAVAPPDEFFPRGVPDQMRAYLTSHPTGKQLALIMSLPRNGPALYLDSDVLFFPGAKELAALDLASSRYLADCQLSADERLFRDRTEMAAPVNTGVLFLARELDWSLGINRFLSLKDAPNFFTNQTITHLVMHANSVQPFDPEKFVLQLDDQFIYADKYASPSISLRHYVNPVRHKFWTSLCHAAS